MRRLILCLVSVILLVSMINLVSAYEETFETDYISAGEGIEIKSLKYEPYPVQPGEIFNIYFIFKNIGGEVAKDATCEIVNDDIFMAYGQKKISAGNLAPGREFSFEFEVKINEDAIERTEELEVRCSRNQYSGYWVTHKIPIKIQHRFTTLNIVGVKTNPEILEIGKEGEIILSIANNAQATLRDVAVELDFANTQIAPAEGITIKKISNIKSNDVLDLTFNVFTMPDTDPNLYKIPLSINYTDSEGEIQSFTTLITIKIGGKPSYYVVPESFVNLGTGIKSVELKFVNNGLTDMQFFNVKVLETGENIYVGDLDSDDYLTETIRISSFWSKTTIPLEISYKDKLNNDYTDKVNVEFNAKKVKDLTQKSTVSRVIIILILGGIAYYVYRRKKRAKHVI